jgi:hypothetical protein
VAPVIGRAVKAHHIEPFLDQCDKGHEMLAVEAVLVEIRGRTVRRRDHRHPVRDQRGEQAREDHRIGAIVHHHFVEGEAADIFDQRGRNLRDRIAALALAHLAHPRVDVEHEGVEMDAPFALDGQMVVKQVHQHRLAAADGAPQIDAARRVGFAPGDPPQDAAARRRRLQIGLQRGEAFCRRPLFGVGLQLARSDQRVIGGKQSCHLRLALRIVPAKLSTICSSPGP